MKIAFIVCLQICLVLYAFELNSQNSEENLRKYWNYRDKFQKYFVRIGSNEGNSINFANIDNVATNAEAGGWVNTSPLMDATTLHGYRKTGDAMNMQGDYISVLAIQYKLLKDEGKDVTSTLLGVGSRYVLKFRPPAFLINWPEHIDLK